MSPEALSSKEDQNNDDLQVDVAPTGSAATSSQSASDVCVLPEEISSRTEDLLEVNDDLPEVNDDLPGVNDDLHEVMICLE